MDKRQALNQQSAIVGENETFAQDHGTLETKRPLNSSSRSITYYKVTESQDTEDKNYA